jgi:hypothetical protein
VKLTVRLFGFEVLAIEQGDEDQGEADWSLGGTTSSDRIGFHQDVEQRPDGWGDGDV